MRKLRAVELVAIWWYFDEYSSKNLSPTQFYKQLPNNEKTLLDRMVKAILKAEP